MKMIRLFFVLLFLMFIFGCSPQYNSSRGLLAFRGTPERNRYVIGNVLTSSEKYDFDDIVNLFERPYYTEQFNDITIWYYPITDNKLIPFVFKDEKLIAYGEHFFETKEWKEGKYE